MSKDGDVVGIVLGFGDLYRDKGAGDLILPVDGSIARCHAVFDHARTWGMKDRSPFVICTAGYGPVSPSRINGERTVSLATQIGFYLSQKRDPRLELLKALPMSWGTEAEVRNGIALARNHFGHEASNVTLVIASHPAHLPRVWLYCKRYLPEGWSLDLVPVCHQFSPYSYWHEIIRLPYEALLLARDYLLFWSVFRKRPARAA